MDKESAESVAHFYEQRLKIGMVIEKVENILKQKPLLKKKVLQNKSIREQHMYRFKDNSELFLQFDNHILSTIRAVKK
jgi:hypothetical protein